jgi:hypothetical protein
LLFRPAASIISQWFPLGPEFIRIRGFSIRDGATRSRKPSLLRSATAEAFALRLRDRMKRLYELKAASLEQVEHVENAPSSAQTSTANTRTEVQRTRLHPIKSPESGVLLSEGLQSNLGPVATAFGEVYQYTIEGQGYTAMELKTLHEWTVKNQLLTLGVSIIVLTVALGSLAFTGTEFMARLDEGPLLITTRKLPGISLSDSIQLSQRIEEAVLEFPEVSGVVTKLGRPDLATEAMGIHEADVYVLLKP